MASESRSRRALVAVVMFIATAVMVWFGNGLTPWWPLMWLAPLPLFWFALHSRWWSAGLLACIAWLAGSTNVLGYFHQQGVPFAVWLADFGGLSLSVALGVLIFRSLVLRGAVWTGMIAPGVLWVTLDWARYLWTPHGTGADLAYTQLEFLPFLQLSALTGPWGMTFVLQLFPAAAAVALHLRKSEPQRAIRVAGIVTAVMALVIGYGTVRLYESGPRRHVKVGLVASDIRENSDVASAGTDAERVLKAYAMQARDLVARGAEIVVMPEKIAAVRNSDIPVDDAILQSVASSSGAIIVAGELQISPGPAGTLRYNRAKVYRPDSAVVSYDKEHMLPPFESNLTPGIGKLSLTRGDTRLGVAICKDMDFTSTSLAYADLGAQLMLVPAWDFNSDRTWHGHMAIMRGVEGGFAIARAARNGYLTVSDDRGRVLAETRSDSAPFATLLADVPVGHERTLFQRWGNWFAWAAIAALALVLARLAGFALSRTYPPHHPTASPSLR
jgi:apolipoprotein N-acyltransferase